MLNLFHCWLINVVINTSNGLKNSKKKIMSPSISIVVILLAFVAFVTSAYQPEPYRTSYGVQNYTRLIDEFSVVSPAKPYRQIQLSLDYPGGVCYIIENHKLSKLFF